MPKFLCRCGHIIDQGPIPNKHQWLMINDSIFDQRFSGMVNSDVVYDAMNRALKCSVCGRLWIFWSDGKPASAYKFEGMEGELATVKEEGSEAETYQT